MPAMPKSLNKKPMKLSPKWLKRRLNIYPPYLGAGIKVEYIRDDWKELQVSMTLRWYNRNAVGTHFGGSLYAMIDPHLMLLLMQLLGKAYWVWDKAAEIDFLKASRKRVRAVIKVSDDDIEEIKRKTENGDKYLAEFAIEIMDEDNELVAKARKVIYVKRK
jgi:acyl-coenzyme A thioesterase PaaI-like protein